MRRLRFTLGMLVGCMSLLGPAATSAEQLVKRDLVPKDARVKNLQFDGQNLLLEVKIVAGESVEFNVKSGNRRAALTSPAQFVDDIKQVVHRRNALIVVGGVGAYQNFSNYTVIDLATLSVKKSFNAYSASMSPDGGKVAFVRFYPLHFTQNPEDQYYVESFDELAGSEGVPANSASSAIEPFETAGTRVIATAGEPRARTNVGVLPESAHRLLGGFTWSADSHVLGFVDGVGKDLPHLVTVTFGPMNVEVKRYKVQAINRAESKYEIDLGTPTGPTLIQIQQQPGGGVSRGLVSLGAAEAVPQ